MKEINGVYLNQTERFNRGELKGLSRAIKAHQHDAGIVIRIGGGMKDIKLKLVGNLSGGRWNKCHSIMRRVYDINGLAPTIHCMGGVTWSQKS